MLSAARGANDGISALGAEQPEAAKSVISGSKK
jgi:hypothetical protein